MNPTIEQTKTLMARLHEGQVDQIGQPYKYHPLRVADNLKKIFPEIEEDAVCAALLHDVMEDCGETDESLLQKGYSKNCVDMIRLVTKPDGDKRPYEQVIEELSLSGNRGAMMIKIADNMDNSHPERMAQLRKINPEKADKLTKRYSDSIKRLSHALHIDPTPILEAIQKAPPFLGIARSVKPHNLKPN